MTSMLPVSMPLGSISMVSSYNSAVGVLRFQMARDASHEPSGWPGDSSVAGAQADELSIATKMRHRASLGTAPGTMKRLVELLSDFILPTSCFDETNTCKRGIRSRLQWRYLPLGIDTIEASIFDQ